MAKSTPATLALQKAGIAFTLHEYDYDPHAQRIGMQAAQALGIEPARLLKTLMAKAGEQVVCVLAPSDREVNLKKLAQATGAKSAAMLGAAEAERITGYHVGGISPFGQKKRVPVFLENSALSFAPSSATAAGAACKSSSRLAIWCACSMPRWRRFVE